MTEKIDIFNANLSHKGSMGRTKAHAEGEWHQTFHLWLCSTRNGGGLIFQLRSPLAKNYPDMMDISAAGHLLAGETPEDGIREATEELGVDVSNLQMHSLGYRVEVADQANGQLNREYQAVFLAIDERALNQYMPDPEEVYGLIDIPIKEGYRLFSGEVPSFETDFFYFDGTGWMMGRKVVTVNSFLPRIQKYYLTMLIMAERLLEGKSVLAIS